MEWWYWLILTVAFPHAGGNQRPEADQPEKRMISWLVGIDLRVFNGYEMKWNAIWSVKVWYVRVKSKK